MPSNVKRISVDLLRHGLYVYALDRPWIETPFQFQGFRIDTDVEIDTLRRYCWVVYVDVERSESDALGEALMSRMAANRSEVRRRDPAGSSPWKEPDMHRPAPKIESPLFDHNPLVDHEAFGSRVEEAMVGRRRLRDVLSNVFHSVAGERNAPVAETRAAVADVAATIKADPTASLWLTRISNNDDYTSQHSINSSVMAMVFAQYLGLTGKDLEIVGLGTLLMDVGRMMVPGRLLPKPGKLSDSEWSYVQRHVHHGVRLLSDSQMAEDAIDIVRMHHERRYGQGYPNGLSSDRIIWPALVAGLVDSYDAMTHKRPYREAYRPDHALQMLYNEADSTFGEQLVSSFTWYMGTYPVGSVVELDNGSVGVVVGAHPGKGVSPTVLIVRDAEGRPLPRRTLLNLVAANSRENAKKKLPARSVRRTLTPEQAALPVGRIVANEFGLDALFTEAETRARRGPGKRTGRIRLR